MKQHTEQFTSTIAKIGRQFDDYITYGNVTLRQELYSISMHYEGSLCKSIMKQLDIESSVDIEKGTKINYKKGLLVGNNYEYLDYGYFYVYSSELSEDKSKYNITCYDAMLFSMVDYTGVSGIFPMTVREYINALCNTIGLTFYNNSSIFVNYDKEISDDPYIDTEGNSLGYTIRDIFDELSQVTASNICITNIFTTEGLTIKYPTETNDIITGDMLKDVNVNFGEKYGPINSIVLSRSAESDNVYLQDEDSVEANGLCELKFVDNQIMNYDDRSDYLPGILGALDGLEYYINDFSSTGVCYYEPCDLYTIRIENNEYKCIMLNDEINQTDGLEELIHTDMPKEAKTDYTKADKTDRKINITNLTVNKHEQEIEALITKTDEYDDTITQLRLDVDGIETKVAGIYDLTRSASGTKTITLENCMKGYILELHIYGNNTVFKYLYPADDLYPSDTLYPHGDSRVIVTDKDGNETLYTLGITDVLRANDEVKDEYILKDNYAKIIRRVNADGTTKETPVEEDIGVYTIYVEEGNNIVTIKNYTAKLDATYIIKNSYTDQFTTQIELNSTIQQKSNEILSEVSEKYETIEGANENYSRIDQTTDAITTEVSKKVGNNEVISKINQSPEAVTINANKINLNGKTINMTSDNINISSTKFSVDSNGNMTCSNANITSGTIALIGGTQSNPNLSVTSANGNNEVLVLPSEIFMHAGEPSVNLNSSSNSNSHAYVYADSTGGAITLGGYVSNDIVLRAGSDRHITCQGYIEASSYNYVSDARLKKDIEEYNINAISLIKNAKIYKYKFKDNDKEEFGLVIGEGYNTPKEIVENHEDRYSINAYRMNSIMWKAIQEQQEQIEDLQKQINELKGEK